MKRPRFDPKLLASALRDDPPAPPPAHTKDQPPWTVSQLAVRIEGSLRDGLPAKLRVVGEVSGPRERTHWYFDLKDAGAVISCVLFASAARRLKVQPTQGAQVVVTGHIDFYAKAGKVSFIADRIDAIGEGSLDQAFRALCDELKALGWFDPARKQPLPTFPRRIAVITSRSGAALQDVIDTARRRCPAVAIALVDVRVQGDGAAVEIARAINALSDRAIAHDIDAIILTRGGGSKEDLWAFNERIVAEAVVNCRVPIVAAIGHETDTTIAELVADERAATPTQAAMRLTPDREALARQLDALQRRAIAALGKTIRFERQRLITAARHPAMADPRRTLARLADRADALQWRLTGAMRATLARANEATSRTARRLEPHRPVAVHARRSAMLEQVSLRLDRATAVHLSIAAHRLDAAARQLDAVSPLDVLNRGYSVTLDGSGHAIRSTREVAPGDPLTTRVADGSIASTVVGPGHAPPPASPKKPARRPRSAELTPDKPQMDLFNP